jgi:hypothetical protein
MPKISWILLLVPSLAFLISSSQLQTCTNDGSELLCKKKLVVALSVQNDQGKDAETLEATLDTASTEDGAVYLEQPIRITVAKSGVKARFPLRYLRDFNAKPRELIVKDTFFTCEDDAYSSSPTCGWRYDRDDKKIWDSQGYCCDCSFESTIGLNSDGYTRGSQCDAFNLAEGSSTAHCLEWDDMWYSCYEVGAFTTQYTMQVYVTWSGSGGNYTTDILEVSPSFPITTAPNRTLTARLVGDFYPNSPPPALNSLYLFAPTRPQTDPRVVAGTRNWMLLDKSKVTLDDSECNKVGTSYSAFRNQNSKCDQRVQSCFQSQLDDFYQEDIAAEIAGSKPEYLLRAYGNFTVVQTPSDRFLQLELPGRYSSLITLELAADSLKFITNVARGVIDFCYIDSFEALSYDGLLECQASNTGNVTAMFVLGVSCSPGVAALEAREFTLEALGSQTEEFEMYVESTLSKNYTCNVTLHNAMGEVVDWKAVSFNTTKQQIDEGLQGGTGDVAGDEVDDSSEHGGSCSDECPGWYDVGCFFAKGCWELILQFFGIVIGIIAFIIVLKIVIKKYGCCCQKLCRLEHKQTDETQRQPSQRDGGQTR